MSLPLLQIITTRRAYRTLSQFKVEEEKKKKHCSRLQSARKHLILEKWWICYCADKRFYRLLLVFFRRHDDGFPLKTVSRRKRSGYYWRTVLFMCYDNSVTVNDARGVIVDRRTVVKGQGVASSSPVIFFFGAGGVGGRHRKIRFAAGEIWASGKKSDFLRNGRPREGRVYSLFHARETMCRLMTCLPVLCRAAFIEPCTVRSSVRACVRAPRVWVRVCAIIATALTTAL